MAPRKGTRPHNKVSPELENAVVEMYTRTGSSRVVAMHFALAKGTVLRITGDHGITKRPWGLEKPVVEKILTEYDGKKRSGPNIAIELGTTPTTVYRYLRKHGYSRRNASAYDYEEDCNHEYFDRIDTAEKAYWLGLLVTDGCISQDNEVILSLHRRDIRTVRRFKKTLGSRAQISIGWQWKSIRGGKAFLTVYASVRIRSRRLCRTLALCGILPGKTRAPRMVKGVPAKFESDFWRGAIDGDGWLCFGRRGPGSRQFILGLTGGLPLVRAFKRYCQHHCPTRARILRNHSVWKFTVTDWFAFDVAKAMYLTASLSMPRKQRKFEAAVRHFSRRTRQKRNWG